MYLDAIAALLMVVFAFVADQGSRSFRKLKDSSPHKKVKIYRVWLATSILCFGVLGILIIYFMGLTQDRNFHGGIYSIYRPYDVAFAILKQSVNIDQAQLLPLGFGFCMGLVILLFVSRTRKGKKFYATEAVSTLRPRDATESVYVIALIINAAISEEIMFRGAFPSLLFNITHNAMFAIIASAIVFGCMHWYQGARGVLSTFCLAVIFSLILGAGFSLYLVIALHFVLNMMALFVFPKRSLAEPG
ncbi:CPBP family intramembrane glutamic endopeptidase [Nguyenibacter vanlangensis]|uniref:CPBP family intramembrane glutamic endopeptidase n=1 Tax=Nguyenibacter vanlangensis TaxID=1216886 RepID=A0ABZ3D7Y1_9PROT